MSRVRQVERHDKPQDLQKAYFEQGRNLMTPRVTILMPVFNRERFADEAIRSVITQDFADFELLIVDDGT